MKIQGIKLWVHTLKHEVPYAYSGGELTQATTLVAQVTTDTGLVGWGESCPLGSVYSEAHPKGGAAAIDEMAPALLGQEALPRVLGAAMDRALEGHRYAKAIIDIAAWDILGKAAGMPVHALLGGAYSKRIPSYFAVRPQSPDTVREEVKRRIDEGFPAIQLKIGTGDLRRDIETIRAALEVIPSHVTLAVDANRKLLVEDTLHLSRLLSDIPFAIEQPCNTPEEMRQLKGRVHHPIYWDESTTSPGVVLDALGQGHADGLGMKVTRVGGITGTCAVRDMAVARGAKISIDDSWGGDIIAAACTHVGATVPERNFRGTWLAAPYIGSGYSKGGQLKITKGHIDVPQGAGLGIDPDPDKFGEPSLEFNA